MINHLGWGRLLRKSMLCVHSLDGLKKNTSLEMVEIGAQETWHSSTNFQTSLP